MQKIQSKKFKRILLIGILLISCITVLIYCRNKQQQDKLENQISQETKQLHKIKNQYKEFRITDKKKKKTYKALISNYEAGIKDKNLPVIQSCQKKLKQLDKTLIEQNTSYYKKQVKKLQKKDLSNAYDNEIERINEIQERIDFCIQKNTFRSIDTLLKEWKELNKNMSLIADNLSISLKQIDASHYPNIDLYLSIHDINTNEVPKNLEKNYLYLTEQNGLEKPKKTSVSALKQQTENGVSHINVVTSLKAQKRKSQKENTAVSSIETTINHLLQTINLNNGSQIELIQFKKGIHVLEAFTSDTTKIKKQLKQIKSSDKIGLYDALYTAVMRTAFTSGTKCIIAFTNGEDNASNIDYPKLIETAKRYRIPIYLIGIGNQISTYTLERIASQTGGFYRNITDETLIEDIIAMIYKEQTDLYQLTYVSEDKTLSFENHNLLIAYQNRLLGGYGEDTFIPAVSIANSSYSLLHGIDTAIRTQLLTQLKEKENQTLLSFEITSIKNKKNQTIEVEFQYTLQKQKKKLHLKTKTAAYQLKKEETSYSYQKQSKRTKTIICI